jgi:RNA polymerase sigma-70 factor (ECF subfamily)
LLREVFDMDYVEVAQMLGKSESTCRQLVHRAKERVRQNRPRFEVSRAAHVRLLERFVEASRGGDIKQLAALFAEDATFTGDGGGKAQSVSRVLQGALRLARFFHVIARGSGKLFEYRQAEINGAPGLLRYVQGRLDTAFTIVTDGRKILDMYAVRNPDKLKHIAAQIQQ